MGRFILLISCYKLKRSVITHHLSRLVRSFVNLVTNGSEMTTSATCCSLSIELEASQCDDPS